MIFRFSQFKKQTSRAAALLLSIWLSGAFCALNCQFTTGQTVASTIETAAEENENLPPCHRKAAQEKSGETETDAAAAIKKSGVVPMMACCAFLNPTFEPAKSFNFVPQVKTAKTEILPVTVFTGQQISFKTDYNPLPRVRGSTYLKNRALLI